MKFPEKDRPQFALPDHEWRMGDEMIDGDVIREINGWKLIRRKRQRANAKIAEKRLRNPGRGLINHLAKEYLLPTKWKKAAIAKQVADSLATLIEQKASGKVSTNQQEIEEAAKALHYLVSSGCQKLMELADKFPQIFKAIAQKCESWPVMSSTHARLRKKADKTLARIEQGKDAEVDTDQISRNGTRPGQHTSGITEIARELLRCVQTEWEKNDNCLQGKPVPRFCDDETCLAFWWEAARSALLAAYPEPEKIPELDRLVTARSRRNYPSHIRTDILKKIKAAFVGLAPR